MTIDCFIRTFRGDAEWLRLCLPLLQRHLRGVRRVVVTCPKQDRALIREVLLPSSPSFAFALVGVDQRHSNDYIGQQISKLEADLTLAPAGLPDLVWEWDSDCLLTGQFDPHWLINEGRPRWPLTHRSLVESTGALRWLNATEQLLRRPVQFEYMRRHGLLVRPAHLAALRRRIEALWNRDWRSWAAQLQDISEWNLLGAFCHANHESEYEWELVPFDPSNPERPQARHIPHRQFWSQSGVSEDARRTYEEAMR